MKNDLKYFTLPNILTLLNLLAGSFAIFFATTVVIDNLFIASYFVLIALIFDFFDGWTARKLNQVSVFGKQLDSLADLVSFGVAPAVIIFQMLKHAMKIKELTLDLPLEQILIVSTPILLVAAAALRLAKFNINDKQEKNFLGLAVPASALFFVSFPIIFSMDSGKSYEFILLKLINGSSPMEVDLAIIGMYLYVFPLKWLYIISIFVFAVLQLINVSMFSLKFDGLSFKNNASRYVFSGVAFLMLLMLQFLALPFIVIIYILFSVVDDIIKLFIKK